MNRAQLLSSSWTQVAPLYRETLVARFHPWSADTVAGLVAAQPPKGAVLVAGCGTGEELVMMAQALPEHRFVGVDLAAGMATLARELVADRGLSSRVEIHTGDAAAPPAGLGPLAAVCSIFCLQQMPRPAQVLAGWTRALMPGGVLAVCFWPRVVESHGPWRRLMELTLATNRPPEDWEAGIPGLALAEGAELLSDARVAHEMSWGSVHQFWEGMTRAGPWHARLLQHGEAHMEALREEFMQGYADPAAELKHAPEARVIVLRRAGDVSAKL